MKYDDPIITDFIDRARAVKIDQPLAHRLGLKHFDRRNEHPQPCPVCRGRDRFSYNTKKNEWVCRGGGVGGRDAIGMAAHCEDLDLRRREGFLTACSIVLGEDIPQGGEAESAEERAARLARMEARRLQAARDEASRASEQADWREAERRKARGIYEAARPLWSSALIYGRQYLRFRGCGYTDQDWLRISADQTYWRGRDERGGGIALHTGPAMVAPFIDRAGTVIGCHITWIDLARAPKYRPLLADPETGELLPTKKMRGSKRGGVIPLAGAFSARRWVGGEGIENGLSFAHWEDFRADTLYFAAGDLGNLAGPADPASRFAHPALKKPDRNGVLRPVMVAGADPRPGQEPDGAMWVADHVEELVLLGDGDSEPVATAAAMARAKKRLGRAGRLTWLFWPKAGLDFSAMAAKAAAGRT